MAWKNLVIGRSRYPKNVQSRGWCFLCGSMYRTIPGWRSSTGKAVQGWHSSSCSSSAPRCTDTSDEEQNKKNIKTKKKQKKTIKDFFNFKSWIPCVRVLDQGDARMAPPLGCSRIESLPHRWSGSLRVMLVPHDHILSPFWCHSFWSHGGSFNPRTSVLTSITIIA